jgi:hypothetical protein
LLPPDRIVVRRDPSPSGGMRLVLLTVFALLVLAVPATARPAAPVSEAGGAATAAAAVRTYVLCKPRDSGCNGARVYTRLRIRSSDGTKHIRFHRRCAD